MTGPKLVRDQQPQFFPALDIDFAPEWEFIFGWASAQPVARITSS
jgi:hypothetical protein